QTNGCTAPIAPHASCGIVVVSQPTSGGARSASLVIKANAPGGPHQVALSGTGSQSLSISPSLVVLPPGQKQQFTVGTTATWSVDGVTGGAAATGTVTAGGL